MAFTKYARASVVKPAITIADWEAGVRAKALNGKGTHKNASAVFQQVNPRQYLLSHCFPPGHLVLMADGTEKPIEEVLVGDLVVTHLGNIRPVTKTLTRKVDEDLVVVQSASLPETSCTGGHPFFAISEADSWCRVFPSYKGQVKCTFGGKQVCKKHTCLTNGASPRWVEAQDLVSGDRTYTPTLHETRIGSDLNPNRMRLLGYYISEGRVDKDAHHQLPCMVRFSIHEEELPTLGSEIARLMRLEFGVSSYSLIRDRKRITKGVTLSFQCFKAAPWFLKHSGCGSRTKRLSLDVVLAPRAWQRQMMGAWLNGDGCYNKRFRLATSSSDLASQAVVIFDRLEVHAVSHRVLPLKKRRKPGPYSYIKPFDGWHVCVPNSYADRLSSVVQWGVRENIFKKLSTKGRYRYAASTISTIQRTLRRSYRGPVHNLSVEGDESYIVNRQAVHNCTIVASVDTEDAGQPIGRHLVDGFQIDRRYPDYLITPETNQYINSNFDSWERKLLLACFRTFIGAENYIEHLQIPEMSKGKIIDAAARDIGDSIYIDILVATDRKHKPLITAIQANQLQTLSMGCTVTGTICTKCGNWAEDETQLCAHVRHMKGNTWIDTLGKQRKIAELCGHWTEPESVKFIEASWVANPAFTGAVLRNILTPEQAIALGGSLDNRIQVAFSQAPRTVDPKLMSRAAYRVSKIGFDFEEGNEEAASVEPEDPMEKAIDDTADYIRERAVEKVRKEMTQTVPRVDLDEDRNETLVKEAISRSTHWRTLARVVLARTQNPTYTRRILLGLLLYRRGGWKTIQASSFSGNEILAISRFLDVFNNTPKVAGEARIYRTVLAVGGMSAYGDEKGYLSACRRVMGRQITGTEKDALLAKGRLYDLGG